MSSLKIYLTKSRLSIAVISILVFSITISCSIVNQKKETKFKIEDYLKGTLEYQYEIRDKILINPSKYLSEILEATYNSPHENCRCSLQYRHYDINDLFCFLYYDTPFYPQILEYAMNKKPKDINQLEWATCILVEKLDDCELEPFETVLDLFPELLRNTHTLKYTNNLIISISRRIARSEYKKMCDKSIKKILEDEEWRASIFESLMFILEQYDEVDYNTFDEIYSFMSNFPDKHTTKFGLDFFLQNDTIPDEICDLIAFRIDLSKEKYFNGIHASEIKGDGIMLTEDQIEKVKARITEVENKKINNKFLLVNDFGHLKHKLGLE